MVSSAVLRTESEAQLAGLDALERADLAAAPTTFGRRAWRATWPKLAAVAIVLIGWQLVVASGWKDSYILPGPRPVFAELQHQLGQGEFWRSIGVTMSRALIGFALAI